MKYNPETDIHFSIADAYKIQAAHDVLVRQIPEHRRFINPRDDQTALIKLGAQGFDITRSEIAGAIARYGGIGTISLTGGSEPECRYTNRTNDPSNKG